MNKKVFIIDDKYKIDVCCDICQAKDGRDVIVITEKDCALCFKCIEKIYGLTLKLK